MIMMMMILLMEMIMMFMVRMNIWKETIEVKRIFGSETAMVWSLMYGRYTFDCVHWCDDEDLPRVVQSVPVHILQISHHISLCPPTPVLLCLNLSSFFCLDIHVCNIFKISYAWWTSNLDQDNTWSDHFYQKLNQSMWWWVMFELCSNKAVGRCGISERNIGQDLCWSEVPVIDW